MIRFTNLLKSVDVDLRRIWVGLFLVSVMGMADIPSSCLLPIPVWGNWVIVLLIATFKSTCLSGLLFYLRRFRIAEILMWVATGFYSILCIINGLVSYLYDMGITIKFITVIGQTNRAEILEFIPSLITAIGALFLDVNTYIVLGSVVILFVICRWISSRIFTTAIVVFSAFGFISVISVFCSLGAGRSNYSICLRVAKSLLQSHREQLQIIREMDKIKELPDKDTVESSCRADIVMVVGESVSRANLSLYGYPLQTSPRLDAMRDSLVIFGDVIGTSTLTAFNMSRILTFLTDSEPAGDWYRKPMLYSLLNEAGYETSWLSNQERSGIWGNSTVAMVSMASDVKFVGGFSSDDATLQQFDGILIPYIREALCNSGRPKFVGVHLMGSHSEYRRRYPDSFRIFNADSILKNKDFSNLPVSRARILAHYVNSLVYTDHILSEIIAMVSQLGRPAVVIYFSDHGENVYDRGGTYCGRDDRHVEVPFVIYPNEKFISENHELLCRLKESCDRPMTTAEISHLICTLTGTRYAAYADSLDVTSPSFIIRHRYVDEKPWKYEHPMK